MRVRVGVNGMGRIGRDLLRIATGRAAAGDACFEVVAVNDLAQPETVAHLLKHDSTYGAWSRSVDAACGLLDVDGHAIRVLQHPDPEDLPWGDLGVDVVVEATGKFRTRAAAAAQPATAAQVNAAFQAAADAQLKGILRCTDEPDGVPRRARRGRILPARHRADPRRRSDGQGLRLVRQRVELRPAHGRPGRDGGPTAAHPLRPRWSSWTTPVAA